MLFGVDIHARYQGSINLALLRDQGYSFMCTKASEGTSIPSAAGLTSAQFAVRFLTWIEQARALGLVPGLYHWLKAGHGKLQAQFFHALVQRAGGPRGMLIQLDCEDNATYADVLDWAQEWRELSGGHPFLLYTGSWWWAPRGWDGNKVTPYLWHSHYLSADADVTQDDPAAFAARIPASWWTPGYGSWPTATVLQFTSRGDAGGLGNNVDLNAFRGTREDLLALTGDDMLTQAQANTMLADTWRLITIMQNKSAAEYQLVGEPSPRHEPNELKALLERIEAAAVKAAEWPVDAAEFEAMHERVMRRILGSVDGATPTTTGD